MKINVELIKQRLFSDPIIRARIIRDYGIRTQPADAQELGAMLLRLFEQEPVARPLEQSINNSDVFQAAVKALASNSRPWATFLKFEPKKLFENS